MIEKPGIYQLTETEYDADPCPQPSLRASIVKILDQESPLHAWHAHSRLNPKYEVEHAEKFDIGRACHALLLQDNPMIALIAANDYRTKDAQASRDEARQSGAIPMLTYQYSRAQRMKEAVRRQLDASDETRIIFRGGQPEQTIIWREGAVWCRARLDYLAKSRFLWDFKSTDGSAKPDLWARRQLFGMGFQLQAAFYLRGVRAALGWDDAQFGFVVAEQNEPFAVSVVGLPPEIVGYADRRVARAIDIWAKCLASGQWPGYAGDIWWGAETPPWDRIDHDEAADRILRNGLN